jgi:hypothetical protein
MQLIAFFISFVMLFNILHFGFPAFAATVQFTPSGGGNSGTLNAEIPVTNVGKLKITNGTAVIRGNTIDVVGMLPGQTTKQSLLSGVVVKTELTSTGKAAQVKGIAYFRQGAAIEALDALSQNAEDIIDTIDGGTYYGHIVSINRDEVEFEDRNHNRRRFGMGEIKAIRGPRVLTFSVPLVLAAAIAPAASGLGSSPIEGASGPKATFSSTGGAKAPPPSSPPGTTEPGFLGTTLGKVIVGTVLAAGIATAITVPIVVGVHNGNVRRHRRQRQQEQLFLLNSIVRSNQPPPTVNTSRSSP